MNSAQKRRFPRSRMQPLKLGRNPERGIFGREFGWGIGLTRNCRLSTKCLEAPDRQHLLTQHHSELPGRLVRH